MIGNMKLYPYYQAYKPVGSGNPEIYLRNIYVEQTQYLWQNLEILLVCK